MIRTSARGGDMTEVRDGRVLRNIAIDAGLAKARRAREEAESVELKRLGVLNAEIARLTTELVNRCISEANDAAKNGAFFVAVGQKYKSRQERDELRRAFANAASELCELPCISAQYEEREDFNTESGGQVDTYSFIITVSW